MAEPVLPESLDEVSRRFASVNSLLVVSALLVGRHGERTFIATDYPDYERTSIAEDYVWAREVAQSFAVARVKYESPWQLLLEYGHEHSAYLIGGGALATLTTVAVKAKKLVNDAFEIRERFWQSNEKVAESKRKIAQSNLGQTVAATERELLEQSLAQAVESRDSLVQAELRQLRSTLPSMPGKAEPDIHRANRALLTITDVDLDGA